MNISRMTGMMCIVVLMSGCASVGTVGLITKSSADPMSVTRTAHTVKELGPAEGKACRYMALTVFPFGKSDLQVATDKALTKTRGDALVNVTVSSNLYMFIPIYPLLTYTCTAVKGTAVKFESKGESSK
jgi:uncharacterized protein YceK